MQDGIGEAILFGKLHWKESSERTHILPLAQHSSGKLVSHTNDGTHMQTVHTDVQMLCVDCL